MVRELKLLAFAAVLLIPIDSAWADCSDRVSACYSRAIDIVNNCRDRCDDDDGACSDRCSRRDEMEANACHQMENRCMTETDPMDDLARRARESQERLRCFGCN
jgi:hypothetical protein